MVKRLRGWQLEKDMEKPPDKLEKGTKSQLATALLSLWAHAKCQEGPWDGWQNARFKMGHSMMSLCCWQPFFKGCKAPADPFHHGVPGACFCTAFGIATNHEMGAEWIQLLEQGPPWIDHQWIPALILHPIPMQEQGDCLLLPPLHFHGVGLQAIISSLLCLIPELLQELTSSVSPGVSSTRLSAKVAPKYRILLHFLLTREGMELASRQIDPWERRPPATLTGSTILEKGYIYIPWKRFGLRILKSAILSLWSGASLKKQACDESLKKK